MQITQIAFFIILTHYFSIHAEHSLFNYLSAKAPSLISLTTFQ